MRSRSSLCLLALVACDRPQPLVICHNANCLGPDTGADDTEAALVGSLALSWQAAPVLDGVEVDTLWFGAESRCLFAHDLDHDRTVPATRAGEVVGAYLASTDRPAWNGTHFYAFIELKTSVGTSFTDRHTPEQYVAHGECALDVLDLIVAGASTRGHQLTAGFIASDPMLLETLVGLPRWQAYPEVERKLVGDIVGPYQVPDLSDYHDLDVVEYHPDFLTEAEGETLRSQGLELAQWAYATTIEAFDALEHWEPEYAITNEAMLMRRWLAD